MPFLSALNFDTVHEALKQVAAKPLVMRALEIRYPDGVLVRDALKLMQDATDQVASPALRELAHDVHGCDEVEIDDEGAGASAADEGTWVQAWVWLSREQLVEAGLAEPDEDEPCETCAASIETRVLPCDECGSLDEDDADDKPTCRAEDCDGDPDDGEGYDGYCGNCADRQEGEDDE